MAAFSGDVTVPPATWVEITDSDATGITAQVFCGGDTVLKGSTGAAPTNTVGGIEVQFRDIISEDDIAKVFRGVPGVTRIFVFSEHGGRVKVEHD